MIETRRAGFHFEALLSLTAKDRPIRKSPFATSKPKITHDRSILNANKRIVLCQGDGVELTLEEGVHEADYQDRTGYCEARFSSARGAFRWPCAILQASHAGETASVLRNAGSLPCCHGSMRWVALLGTRGWQAWAYGTPDPDLTGLYFAQRDWTRAAYASWEHGNILPQFA